MYAGAAAMLVFSYSCSAFQLSREISLPGFNSTPEKQITQIDRLQPNVSFFPPISATFSAYISSKLHT